MAAKFQASAHRLLEEKRRENKKAAADLKAHETAPPSQKKIRSNPALLTAYENRLAELKGISKKAGNEEAHLESVEGMAEDKQAIEGYRNIVAWDQDRAPVGLLRMYADPKSDPRYQATDASGTAKPLLKIESLTALPTAPGTGTRLIADALRLAQKDHGGRVWLRNQSEGAFYAKMGFRIVPDAVSTENPDGLITPNEDNRFGFGEKMLFDTNNPGDWREQDGRWTRVRPQPPADAAQGGSTA